MHKLNDLNETELFNLLEYILPKEDESIFSSEEVHKYNKYNYNIYEDLSELIIKNSIKNKKVIINGKIFFCYFIYKKETYMLQVLYDINYSFCYKKISNSNISTKKAVNLDKLLKKISNTVKKISNTDNGNKKLNFVNFLDNGQVFLSL